jgi:hypothetical protein
MPVVRRAPAARLVFVAFAVALTAQAVVPAAAGAASPPSTVPAPPTSVAPAPNPPAPNPPAPAPPAKDLVPEPPAFSLPLDSGIKLVEEGKVARAQLKAWAPQLVTAKARAAEVQKHMNIVVDKLRRLSAKARDTAQKLQATRDNLRNAAASAYVHAGNSDLASAISSFADAKSAIDMSRNMHIIDAYGQLEQDALDRYLALKKSVDRQIQVVSDEHDKVTQELEQAKATFADLDAKVKDAQKRIKDSEVGVLLFHAAASSASSPIMGPSRLTPYQLSQFVIARGYEPRITVPIEELATYYIAEGARYGIRGDVAWAQSILETAGFHLPDYGQVAGGDNNFAGIGACDSCKHGFTFPDARTGVRAQMQLLRTYVDPEYSKENSPDKVLLGGSLTLGFRGKVQTWWDLWGTWATGALYGERVYNLYLQMVEFAKTVPPEPPVTPGAPGAPAAPAAPATTAPPS